MNYKAIIPYKVVGTVSHIVENENMNFSEALHYLYGSRLYEYLSDETTKLWHLSTEKLYDMLKNEKKNKFEFPDFV